MEIDRPNPLKQIAATDAFIDGIGAILNSPTFTSTPGYIRDVLETTITYMSHSVGFNGVPKEVTSISLQSVGIDIVVSRPDNQLVMIPESARQTWDLFQMDQYAQALANGLKIRRQPRVSNNQE